MQYNDDAMLELAELYALGGLEADERRAVEGYAASATCSKALANGMLAAYALAKGVETPPPASLRERVLAIPGRASAQKVVPMRRSLWAQPGWLAAAAAAVVLVFAGTWALQSRVFNQSWAAGCTPQTTPCTLSGRVIAWGPSELHLVAHGLTALPAGKVYQAWFIRPGAPPTPAPTFVPDARGDASVALPVGPEKGLTIAVTVEPAGGSRAPTTKPFFVASIN
jgi:anti-sigma-K factor RskA